MFLLISVKFVVVLRKIKFWKIRDGGQDGRLGIQPLFGDEPVFFPRRTSGRVRLGSCHWRQQPDFKKVMLNMRIYFHIWQIWCNEETLSGNLILSRVFSGYYGSLCSNLEQVWKIVHQRAPRTVCIIACLFTTVEARNITASFHVVVQRAGHY